MPKLDDYIRYSATSCTDFISTSPTGLPFVTFGSRPGSFRIPGIEGGNAGALALNIVGRYRDGIMLDVTGQISNICNWAHAQDVPAREALTGITGIIENMGDEATEFQKTTRERALLALSMIA